MTGKLIGTVLVVEDDPELRFILGAHLRAAGFEILEAVEGQRAYELAVERRPDIVIMDIGLPGMDGMAATRLMKGDERTREIPVVMLTARSRSEDVVNGFEAGAQEYLFKPFDVAELLARVRTVHRLSAAHKDLDRLNSRLEAEVDAKTRRLRLLYEYMRDLNRADTRDEILDLLVRVVQTTIDARRISLFLSNPARDTLICERAVGMKPDAMPPIQINALEGIAGQVFRTGKTYAAKAYPTPNSTSTGYFRPAFVSTPLVSTSLETGDGIIGVLNVTERASDDPFSEEEIDCIRSVAGAAAIGLDNVTRQERLQQSVRVLLETVGLLAEYRDEETTLHLRRVSKYARTLALELREDGPYASLITDDFVECLVQAAPMHDIGKVGIPDEILTKPGKLTDEEYQIMKMHTEIGRRVLSQALDPTHPVPMLQTCIDIAHGHHERWDGSGYPQRLRGTDISLSARIIALVDAYDAITSDRRYKKARTHAEAIAVIGEEGGRHFDPTLVEAFLRCEDRFNAIRQKYDDKALAAAFTFPPPSAVGHLAQ